MMKKITLLINGFKDFNINAFKQKIEKLEESEEIEILFISYQNKTLDKAFNYSVFSVEDHEDVSFSQVLQAISTKYFLFFNPDIDYPIDFFNRISKSENENKSNKKYNAWEKSIIAIQQSHYGLCGQKSKSKKDFSFLNSSVLYNKKDVESLNTDKMNVHLELSGELYKYALKKKLDFIGYKSKNNEIKYNPDFTDLMQLCKEQAQNTFKLFPVLFVLFFIVFGFGAAFNPVFFLIFLIGMSAYFLVITLEAFGISTIKQNGAIVPILLLLFPFIHLVYGIESLIAKIKS